MDKEDDILKNRLKKIPFEQIQKIYNDDLLAKEEQAKQKRKMLQEHGIAIDPFTFADNLLSFE